MPLPPIAETGDLPQGVHHASLREVLNRFGQSTHQRKLVGIRLRRVYELVAATGQMSRCIVFGSFVTGKSEPNDVDLFFLMDDSFELDRLTGEARLVFDHLAAQAHFGASVFWQRSIAAFPDEENAVLGWQIKRDGTRRGIVAVTGA